MYFKRLSIDNSTFERVEEFKYLGATLTNQNFIAEEIEVRKCLLSFGAESFVFQVAIENLKIKIYRTIILPIFLWVRNLVADIAGGKKAEGV